MSADLIVECTAQNPGKRVPIELPAFVAMVAEHMQLPDNVVPLPVAQAEPSVPADPESLPAIDHQSDINTLFASVERLSHEAGAARAWATKFEAALGQIWERLSAIRNDEVQQRLRALEARLFKMSDEQQAAGDEDDADPLPSFLRGTTAGKEQSAPPPLPEQSVASIDADRIVAAVATAMDKRTAAIEQMVAEAEDRLMAMMSPEAAEPAKPAEAGETGKPPAVALRETSLSLVAAAPDPRVWTVGIYARDGQDHAADLMTDLAPHIACGDYNAAAAKVIRSGDAAAELLVAAYGVEQRTLAQMALAATADERAAILARGIETIYSLGAIDDTMDD
jgi:hypothetical protein